MIEPSTGAYYLGFLKKMVDQGHARGGGRG